VDECKPLVVGTLDYHVGARLPGEMLEGSMPGPTLRPAPENSIPDWGVGDEIDVSVATLATFAEGAYTRPRFSST